MFRWSRRLAICGLLLLLPSCRLSAEPVPAALAPSSAPAAPLTPSVAPTAPVVLTVAPAARAPDLTATVVGQAAAHSIDVGGYTLFLDCQGSGSPTVILDAAFMHTSADWGTVQGELQPQTRVCVYDRANLGLSGRVPTPRTSRQFAHDLHVLLTKARIPGPYLLVANGEAGFTARIYYTVYPHEVAGMILVDSAHPDQYVRWQAALPLVSPNDAADLRATRQALHALPPNAPQNVEGFDFERSAAEVQATGTLGTLPLMVLTATRLDAEGVPAALVPTLEQVWSTLQEELTHLSSRSTQIRVAGSGHFIQLDQPHAVVDAIQRMLTLLQQPAR